MEVPQGVDPSFWAFCSWMHNPMNRSLHHLRTQSLLFHSLPQVAFHTYCPRLFINMAIYSLNVKTKDEEISDGLIHTPPNATSLQSHASSRD